MAGLRQGSPWQAAAMEVLEPTFAPPAPEGPAAPGQREKVLAENLERGLRTRR